MKDQRITDLETALALDREKALRLMSVSRETEAKLELYVGLLQRWQKIKNLVGPQTLPVIWTRHMADSAQLAAFVPDTARVLVDIGSGAGFPGLVLAVLFANRPGFQAHLIESNGRKAAFLREVARTLALPVSVHDVRIEDARAHLPEQIDVLTARALAPLSDLLTMRQKLTQNPCRMLFLKGQDVDAELTGAAKCWNIDSQIAASLTDPSGRILIVERATPKA